MAPLHKNKENALLKTEQYIFVLYFSSVVSQGVIIRIYSLNWQPVRISGRKKEFRRLENNKKRFV